MRTTAIWTALLCGSLALAAPAHSEPEPPGLSQFMVPYCSWGLAIGADGCVYVGDFSDGLVRKYSETGAPLLAMGPVAGPAAVAIGPNGDVFVAELIGQRISEFTPSGRFVRSFGGPRGSGPGQFQTPGGVAVDPQGRVYAADMGNHRIEVFDANGGFLAEWPVSGSAPIGLAAEANGVLDVGCASDMFYGLRRYTFDGALLAELPIGGLLEFAMDGSTGVIAQRGSIHEYDLAGRRVWTLTYGPFPYSGGCPSGYNNGLALAPDGLMYVASDGIVRIYGLRSTPTATGTWGRLKSRYR